MQRISESFPQREKERSKEKEKLNNYRAAIVTIDFRIKKVDWLLEQCRDLIHPDYTPWFAKHFYRLGDQVMGIADEARGGTEPQRLFCYLIKSR